MKKKLKKASMLLCSMVVAIGFLGGKVEASSKTKSGYARIKVERSTNAAGGCAEIYRGDKLVKTVYFGKNKSVDASVYVSNLKKGYSTTFKVKYTDILNPIGKESRSFKVYADELKSTSSGLFDTNIVTFKFKTVAGGIKTVSGSSYSFR